MSDVKIQAHYEICFVVKYVKKMQIMYVIRISTSDQLQIPAVTGPLPMQIPGSEHM